MKYRRLIDEGSLWIMVAAPSVWAAHFLLCYWAAAVWCAKVGPDLDTVFWIIMGLTAACLLIVLWLGWKARRDYDGRFYVESQLRGEGPAHDGDTVDDRRRFLGHATLLLCGLSFIAIVVDAAPILVFDRC